MPGLHLYMSNRLERLADELAEVLSEPLGSPLDAEAIVVQSRGMERWLRMEMALRHGICANVEFPFPNAMVRMIYSSVIPDMPLDTRYHKGTLVWRIMDVLPGLLHMNQFVEVKDYLGPRPRDDKLYQLCKYISACLDQYLIYRPDMVLRWEAGEGRHWQAILWREITFGPNPIHWARAIEVLEERLRESRCNVELLPKRICVFGISSLPPYHLRLLASISTVTSVHFFVMNPCAEYWFDIVPERKIDKLIREEEADYHLPERLHLETGNGLLASLGQLGKDFISLIMSLEPLEHTYFEEPDSSKMLGAVQRDILKLKEASSLLDRPLKLAGGDKSITFHSCHSPLREIEVLYDSLLEVFEQEQGIEPRDVVVMAPDISTYIPFIRAVFESRQEGPKAIPYSIADRGYGKFGHVTPALLHLFDLVDGRFPVSQVLTFLEREPVRKRFGLSEDEIDEIRRLLSNTRASWGVDEKAKETLSLPPTRENTWQACMERLLLGHAMAGNENHLFRSILPYDDVEGDGAELVGRFASFMRSLISIAMLFAEPATLEQWYWRLSKALDDLFSWDETWEQEVATLRRIVSDLRLSSQESGFGEPVSFKVIKNYLETQLEDTGLSGGFLSRGVTFCSILPMRSIPFKVVCLIGMNHDAYPRQSRKLAFDLMAVKPRKGDRSRRNDDRYLFLEALLSARRRLIISYVGQSERDNSKIPPSPLVSELMDYLDRNLVLEDGVPTNRIVYEHRLHSFNISYFEPGSGLFTYFDENLSAARTAYESRKQPSHLFKEKLPPAAEKQSEILVEDLERFLEHPVKYLMRERLGIGFRAEVPLLRDEEPMALRGLDDYIVNQRILRAEMGGEDSEKLFLILKALGILPHGSLGRVEYSRRRDDIEKFVQEIKEFTGESEPRWIDVEMEIGGCRLQGRVGELYPGGLVHYRYGKVRAKDHLRIWLHHLLLMTINTNDQDSASRYHGKNEKWVYLRPDEPARYLEQIVHLYLEGLSRPIKLFPETSFAYSEKYQKGRNQAECLRAAQLAWGMWGRRRGERDDDYYRLCFGEASPLDEDFVRVAKMVVLPILKFRKKI